MPSFCRHNRLIQNCPICSREQDVELRPVLSSSAPRSAQPRPTTVADAERPAGSQTRSPNRRPSGPAAGVRVRRLGRGGDDGYRSPLVLGLKSSAEAARLADELAFAATRLDALERDPPGLYAEVAGIGQAAAGEGGSAAGEGGSAAGEGGSAAGEGGSAAGGGDREEQTWLAFLIAYFGPLEGAEPFAAIAAARTSWASGQNPDPGGIEPGPRGAHGPARGARTLEAYRAWAQRAGSQAAAFTGEAVWTPQRRFARAFERLALPGLHRDARFDLLVTLGRLGLYELAPGSLALGGDNSVTVGAKRALGIGDPLLLDRRAADLAGACELPLEALDLGLHNWQQGDRVHGGLPAGREPDPVWLERTQAALGL